MSSAAERGDRNEVGRAYESALNAYLAGDGEAALARGYEIGRKAALDGVGVLEMAMAHHEALLRILSNHPDRPEIVRQAAQFFAESLAPFEMTLRADVALRQAKTAAEVANRELESFSYSVAHDLRAPLRGIDGFSAILLEECADRLDDQGKKYLDRIRNSTQRMSHMIDDLLALSRLSRTDLHRTRVDLTALANSIIDQIRVTDDRSVECVVQAHVWAIGDIRLLRTALGNLLGNAWKFTRKRADARIEFGAEAETRPVTYFVRDNGAGFDMAYASKLFGVFQRLHSTEDFEGTGIGLATVQRVVKRHGGRIWAEAQLGAGATFYFTLEDGPAV